MTKSILTTFGKKCVSFIGTNEECHKLQKIINKWCEIETNVFELFDSGLNYIDNTCLLMFENDNRVHLELEHILIKTQLQGKTDKTIYKKIDYLKSQISNLFYKNYHRLLEEHDIKDELILQTGYSNALFRHYINYYFSEFDKELNFNKLELYKLEERGVKLVNNINFLENNNLGKTKPKLNLFSTSETELKINVHERCCLEFRWDDMNYYDACKLMGECEQKSYAWQEEKPIYKELKNKLKNCSISVMDRPNDMYGGQNNYFYIYFLWKHEHFKYSEVIKAEKLVNKLIYSKIKGKKFRPNNVPAKYSIVQLGFN